MPELPEVETIARYLSTELIGRRLLDLDLRWHKTLHGAALGDFKRLTSQARFVRVTRRGKYLVFELRRSKQSCFVLVHLRMSGALQVFPARIPAHRHDRAIFRLSGGKELRFNDTRKFGRIYLAQSVEQITGKLGPEPLADDFICREFCSRLRQKKSALKPLLLDQSFVAGLGNIYVDEALWRARLHPLTRANKISAVRAAALFSAIRHTLNLAIKNHGTDIGDNVVEFGGYTPQIYQRDGKPCRRCRKLVKRIVVGQRGTHFCPGCQRR